MTNRLRYIVFCCDDCYPPPAPACEVFRADTLAECQAYKDSQPHYDCWDVLDMDDGEWLDLD